MGRNIPQRTHMGDRLEALLREKGWRQADLARETKWSRQYISKLFSRDKWDADTLFRIATVTNTPETFFFRDQTTLPGKVTAGTAK